MQSDARNLQERIIGLFCHLSCVVLACLSAWCCVFLFSIRCPMRPLPCEGIVALAGKRRPLLWLSTWPGYFIILYLYGSVVVSALEGSGAAASLL